MTTVRQALLRNRLPATGQAWEPFLCPVLFINLTSFVPLDFDYRGKIDAKTLLTKPRDYGNIPIVRCYHRGKRAESRN